MPPKNSKNLLEVVAKGMPGSVFGKNVEQKSMIKNKVSWSILTLNG